LGSIYAIAEREVPRLGYSADYVYVAAFLAAGVFIPVSGLLLSAAFRPKKPSRTKLAPYECGLPIFGTAQITYHASYYMYALLFIVFDVETVFLYPWAVTFKELGLFAFIEMVIFIAILALGLAYACKKRALEWM
jgi:NADH:ubiquinone oxidoreductase subunit 3 (subunit A)